MLAISKSGNFGNTSGYLLVPLWALLLHGLYILRSCLPYGSIMLLQELLIILFQKSLIAGQKECRYTISCETTGRGT